MKFDNVLDLRASEYKAVDFYLTKSCNKSCHYCTSWTLDMRNLTVDIDFLRKTLEYLSPYKTVIGLVGGEPGLIKNLKEVVDEIKKHENFIVNVLSNSLVRKFHPWVLEDPDVIYTEHLVLDFYEDRIEKLGNYDFFEKNDNQNYNLIIKTPNFFKYREMYRWKRFKHKNTLFKEYNSRSPIFDVKEQSSEADRRICAKFPSVPVFDFEIKKIRHCSKKVIDGSRQFDITKENVDKMMTFKLFEFESYCQNCYDIMPPNSIAASIQRIKLVEERTK